ncbi:MAG: PAS domain S-box protein [Rudanella sp.]|nr:PAS domain S-box protein [Rudanella sp.]
MTTQEKDLPISIPRQEKIRVLLVEDDEDDYVLTRTLVSSPENATIRLDWIDNYADALKAIQRGEFDVYLVDYRLGEHTGIDLIQEAFRLGSSAPMILLTGQDDLAVDYSALELGAADYLVKGRIDPQLLGRSIRYALRQAETLNELAKNENKYRALFERSMDAIFVMDNQMVFQDANPSVEQMLGYSRDELKHLNVARLFANADSLREIRFMVREHNQLKDYETTLVSNKGRKRTCLVSIWSVDDTSGKPNWYQGIIRDVTEQKRAQQDLIVAEKLSMTGKIARSIAHEVRNPLTNLSLALEQLKEELPENDECTGIFTDIIQRNVERIGQLITEMINSSKPRDLDRKPQDLTAIVQDTLHLVTDRLKLKSIKLTTNFCPSPCIALLDQDQIKTALLNILINAVEAMEPGEGALHVATVRTDDDQVCIKVQDNGSGISEENRQRLFDPFFTAKSAGMGLGLTTTQNIINSHKGNIEVISKLGEGTTFCVCFPTA